MREYIKIETLFKRSENGSKKLIEGEYRNETVKYLKDLDWEFTEKIDGTNIRIHWDGHKVSFAGRTDRAQIPAQLVNKLNELFKTNEAEELFEQKFGGTEVILYGEGYGAKIQTGKMYRSDMSFILFDVLIGDTWLKRESVIDIAKAFGIDIVPVVMVGRIEEAVAHIKTSPQSLVGNGIMEGIVGRPMFELKDRLNKRIIVKIKVKDFV